MMILRKIGKIFFGILFSLFFTLTIFLFFTSQILSYKNLKKIALPILQKQIFSRLNQTEINAMYQYLLFECKGETNITQKINGIDFTLDCKKLQKVSPNESISLIAGSVFEQMYYKKYNCKLVQCIKQDKMFLLSFSFYQDLQRLFKYSVVFTVIIGILYLFLMENWTERLNGFGSTFLFTGFSYIFVFLSKRFLPAQITEAYPVFLSVFQPLLYFLFAGIVLIVFGQIIKQKKK